MLEQILAWVQDNQELVTSGVAGAVLGPILSKILRGGLGTGTLGGLIGGVAAHFGADPAGVNDLIAGEDASQMMVYLQNIVEGAVGGGVLGGGGGLLAKLMSRK